MPLALLPNRAIHQPLTKAIYDLLQADIAAIAAVGKITVSALSGGPPASPSDGDIWVATGVDANGTRWQFQYNAGSASSYKWEFVGGPDFYAENVAAATALANGGNNVDATAIYTVVRAGDYHWHTERTLQGGSGGVGSNDYVQVFVTKNGAGPVKTQYSTPSAANFYQVASCFGKTTGCAVSDVLAAAAYKNGSGFTVNSNSQSLRVRPVRIA